MLAQHPAVPGAERGDAGRLVPHARRPAGGTGGTTTSRPTPGRSAPSCGSSRRATSPRGSSSGCSNNRRNGYYWRSTRDTTLCVAAHRATSCVASGEGTPDYTLRFDLDDGAVVKEVKIIEGQLLHLRQPLRRGGRGPRRRQAHAEDHEDRPRAPSTSTPTSRYFTKEEHITAAGHELKVDRTYFRLKQIPYEVEVEGADGQKLKEKRLRYERVAAEERRRGRERRRDPGRAAGHERQRPTPTSPSRT